MEKNDTLRQEVDSVYTPLEVAKEEIWRRWNDTELRKKVEEFLGGDIPEMLMNGVKAVLSRHVMSPNFEMLHFLDGAKEIGLEPVGLEYLQDKFVTKNEDKYYLGKMVFYEGTGKRGGRKISSQKILDLDHYNGKKISSVQTVGGKNFADFHHMLASPFLPTENIIDMSEYYSRNGMIASNYYTYILSLFICHGVLFENFLLNDIYSDLTRDILLPSFYIVQKRFGVRPLIVRMVPVETEEDVYWRYYPKSIKKNVCDIMKDVQMKI